MTAIPSNPPLDGAGESPARRPWRWWWLALVVPAALAALALALLVLIVAVNVSGQGAQAKLRATHVSLATIQNAISGYQLDQGSFPSDLNSLVTTKFLASGIRDGWNQPFVYDPKGTSKDEPYILGSSGPDLRQGTEDDISVWDLK